MRIEEALEIVRQTTPELLRAMSRESIVFITEGMTGPEVQTFIFAKNVKIFGGINGYVNKLFSTDTVTKIKQIPYRVVRRKTAMGFISNLVRMLTYPDLSVGNKERIELAIADLQDA